MSEVTESNPTMAKQIALAASEFQRLSTGRKLDSVSVLLGGATLVVTLHGALSPAEQAMAQNAEGAANVQEFHQHLFASASDLLRSEIKRITGMDVREAKAEIEPASGAVATVFTTGTVVQVFQLSGKVPPGNFDAESEK